MKYRDTCEINHPRTSRLLDFLWQKNIRIVAPVLFFACLLSLVLFLIFSVRVQICDTSMCKQISDELNSIIDTSADPCSDFYSYTCSFSMKNNDLSSLDLLSQMTIAKDRLNLDIRKVLEMPITHNDTKPLVLAKRFYISCLDENSIRSQGLGKIKEILRYIGGWPTLEGDSWNEEEFDWIRCLVKLGDLGVNSDVFFKVSVDKDKVHATRYVLGVHDVQYSPAEINSELRNLYVSYMVDIAVVFGCNKQVAYEDAQEVLDMFLELAKITKMSVDSNQTNLYDKLSITELSYQYPTIPWFEYIRGLLNPYDITLTYSHEVIVADPVYIRKLERFLRDSPKRKLANFIAWHSIQYLINYLPEEVLDKAHKFLKNINMGNVNVPRWKICLKATQDRLNPVIAATFIEKFFQDDIRPRITLMIENLKQQFISTILAVEWLDKLTRDLLLEKLVTSVTEIISYNDWLELLQHNELIFGQVDLRNLTFLDMVLSLDRINMNIEFRKLRKIFDDNLLNDSKFVMGTKIYYAKNRNSVALPIGIIRSMYYSSERPEYLNYGIMGSLIAHEISHIFFEAQDRYSRSDLLNRWTPISLLRFHEKLKCLSDQYHTFLNQTELHLRTNKSQNMEDMADWIGMRISYETYVNEVEKSGAEPLLPNLKYSPNQLFWIFTVMRFCQSPEDGTRFESGDDHFQYPNSLRVNRIVQNLEEFSVDFGCARGTQMNPDTKCKIW